MRDSPGVHAGLQDRNAAKTSYLDWTRVNMTPNDLKMPPTVIVFINNPPTTKNVLALNCDIMVVVNCLYVKWCDIVGCNRCYLAYIYLALWEWWRAGKHVNEIAIKVSRVTWYRGLGCHRRFQSPTNLHVLLLLLTRTNSDFNGKWSLQNEIST